MNPEPDGRPGAPTSHCLSVPLMRMAKRSLFPND